MPFGSKERSQGRERKSKKRPSRPSGRSSGFKHSSDKRSSPSSVDTRRQKELQRQQQWRASQEGKRPTNEWRRNPESGKFEAVHTSYGTQGRKSHKGFVAHGTLVGPSGQAQDYEGIRGTLEVSRGRYGLIDDDKNFGRDVGMYGRKASFDEAMGYMSSSQWKRKAFESWDEGNFGDYISQRWKGGKEWLGTAIKSEVRDFAHAPLDWTADFLDNPLVTMATSALGVGLPAFGIKVADAIMDIHQEEEDSKTALANVALAGLSFLPAAKAIPAPLRTVAKAGLKEGGEGIATAASGIVGGKVGGEIGGVLGDIITDNPLAKSAIAVAGTVGGRYGAQRLARDSMTTPRTPTESPLVSSEDTQVARTTPSRRDKERPSSPLVASGERAVERQQALMQQPDVDLYAQTVKQLPYYGLDITEPVQKQFPYYGV